MLKYLRIAVTALSLTACVLLLALWMRSYWWLDTAHLPYMNTQNVFLFSVQGRLGGSVKGFQVDGISLNHSNPRGPVIVEDDFGQIAGVKWVQILRWRTGLTELNIPYWQPVVLTATLATVPWIHRLKRFSLRTLLIATTLIAVGLGIVVAFS